MQTYQITDAPIRVDAGTDARVRVYNYGATVYYKTTSDVSSGSSDGNITTGNSLLLTASKYFATAAAGASVLRAVDVDAGGFELTHGSAPISSDALEALGAYMGGTGALVGASVAVTGAITGATLTTTGAIAGTTGTFSGLVSANAGVDVGAALAGPVYKARQIATNPVVGNKLLTADANYAYEVLGDGKTNWGAGGASAVDTNLYRSVANTLKTDDALTVEGVVTAKAGVDVGLATAGPSLKTQQVLANTVLSNSLLAEDVNHSIEVLGSGKINWGVGGATAVDTNLYRSAADTLKTDDALIVTGALTSAALGATTGAFSDTLSVSVAGKGIAVKEGSNAKQGVATLIGGTATVLTSSVTADSRIFLTAQDADTIGPLQVSARTPATSFVITSAIGTDHGVVAYEVFEPAA